MPEQFSVQSERAGRIHRLVPLGELDIATVGELRELFEAAFGDGDAEMIVVDLTSIDFIDSTAINLLVWMNDVCNAADRLRIVNGSPSVVRVLDLTGVRSRLPIISSADDPLAPLPRE
jgi:anti-anti-sigma factor